MYAEFVGLTAEVVASIERLRRTPEETKSDILGRVLRPLINAPLLRSDSSEKLFDLGQGVRLGIGEKLMLFLSKLAKQNRKPDGVAEIRPDGFYLEGQRIHALPLKALDPAMKLVQTKK